MKLVCPSCESSFLVDASPQSALRALWQFLARQGR
jgi:hypothetical protein